jgi:hypothetical protein
MKITLEFDNAEEAREALDASKYRIALWDIEQELRKRYKYSDDDHEIRIAKELRTFFYDTLNTYNITTDE